MEKHQAGYILKKNGASHTEISIIQKVSLNTVTTWSKKYNWDERISEELLFADTSGEKTRRLIQHNLTILEAIAERRMEAIKDIDKADISDLEKALTDKGQVDALQKLFTTIKGKELDWEKIVKIVRELVEYVANEKPDLASALQPIAHEYLNEKRQGG